MQLKCNELKRARLADDLNEKLAKRPGPLELVESGILVSSDSALTEAIRDGKIVYPRTTDTFMGFNFVGADSPLDYGCDEENSNGSQGTTGTTSSSFNFMVNSPVGSIGSQNSTATAKNSPFSSFDLTGNQMAIDSSPKAANKTSGSNSTTNNAARKIKSSSSLSTISSSSSIKSNKSVGGASTSSQGTNKKVLIFHEYRGPHQKSSKTSIKLSNNNNNRPYTKASIVNRTNKSLMNNSSNVNAMSSSATQQSQTANNNNNNNQEMANLFEDNNSNESNATGGAMGGYGGENESSEELLNAYKIRLEQQKMFLLFDNGELDFHHGDSQSERIVGNLKVEDPSSIEQQQQQQQQSQSQMQLDNNIFTRVNSCLFLWLIFSKQ